MVHQKFEPFLNAVQDLIDRRSDQRKAGKKPRNLYWETDEGVEIKKKWTATQFRTSVYSSYQAMRDGKIKNLPPRDKVMKIADYFECTFEERNRLLVAAGTYPLPAVYTGETLRRILQIAQRVLDTRQEPAYIMDREWNVQAVNTPLLHMIGVDREQYMAIAPWKRNLMQMIFDPELPLYHQLSHSFENWMYIAKRNIHVFKLVNMYYEYDEWYQQCIARWSQLRSPDQLLFSQYWKDISIDSQISFDEDESPFPFYTTSMQLPTGERVTIRSLTTSVSTDEYPQIISYMPDDVVSMDVFRQYDLITY